MSVKHCTHKYYITFNYITTSYTIQYGVCVVTPIIFISPKILSTKNASPLNCVVLYSQI